MVIFGPASQAFAELEHHVQHAVTYHTALHAGRAVTDGGKCRLDWMGRAKVLSVHHRKIIKRH